MLDSFNWIDCNLDCMVDITAEALIKHAEKISRSHQGALLESNYPFRILYKGITTVVSGDPHWYQYFTIEGKQLTRDELLTALTGTELNYEL